MTPAVIPVVTGGIDPGALDDLVGLCLQYAGHGPHCGSRGRTPDPARHPARRQTRPVRLTRPEARTQLTGQPARIRPATGRRPEDPLRRRPAATPPARPAAARPRRGQEMLRQAIIGRAVDLVSGPRRARQLPADPAAGRPAGRAVSLPLDVGHSAEIPAAIRRAVILRDQHCRWAGGCDQPASACEVHHVTHLADGGTTSVDGCALYCFFHHHVAIHQWGWTVALHPDGTTTARSPDGTKTLHSHSPPTARPG